MNIEEMLDKMDENPVKWIAGFWLVGGLISLVGLVVAILVIVAVLKAVGVA